MSTAPKVDLQVELPEELHEAAQAWLEQNPAWSQGRLFAAATSLFLMQNGACDRAINRAYLDTLFDYQL